MIDPDKLTDQEKTMTLLEQKIRLEELREQEINILSKRLEAVEQLVGMMMESMQSLTDMVSGLQKNQSLTADNIDQLHRFNAQILALLHPRLH